MTDDLYLREVVDDDLPLFFDFQLDPDANYMAAFTAKDPTDRESLDRKGILGQRHRHTGAHSIPGAGRYRASYPI